MRVLLVKTSSMGDIVHALPVVADLHAAFPGIHIEWLVEEAYTPIVQAHPGVENVIPLALRRWRKTLLQSETRNQWRAFVHAVRARPFDAIIDLQGLIKSAVIARLARGTHFGLSWASSREALASILYDRRMQTHLGRTEAAVQRYRELASWALGYTPAARPLFGLQVRPNRPSWLQGCRPYVVLLSATAKERKLWAEERWVALAQWLRGQGLVSVFAWGNASERARAERLAARVNAHAGHDAQGFAHVAPEAFGLDIWMEVLKAAHLVVGVDTGLLYLGAAVGTPAVAIYAGSSPHSVEFESSGPWQSLGDDGKPPDVQEVVQAVSSVLGRAAPSVVMPARGLAS